jgi:DNA-nicking Smr family endonuclease
MGKASKSFGLDALRPMRDRLKEEAQQQALLEQQAREAEHQRQQEADVFRKAVKEVKPLKSANRIAPQLEKPLPIPQQHLRDEANALQESLSDEMDIERLLDTDDQLSYRRNGIGPDILRKLRRGHWTIQDQLDLHGLRRDEARETLGAFLRNCLKQDLRCVRIIHGKGHGSLNKEPVLKNKVRVWLVQKEEVLAFCQAKAADGGSGALVVLLRAA